MNGLGGSRAGFVLVGGASSRMGRDKALLEFEGSTVAARIAECVRSVAGNVTLIGPPERYRQLGYNIIPDRVNGFGPIGGVYTALESTHSEWNLIVACDMPFITPRLLEELFADAESGPSTADVIVPESNTGDGMRLDPLCAVYQRRCGIAARRAIDRKMVRMQDFFSKLRLRRHPVADAAPLANLNTPAEWSGV
jgi:molybdopterin-guanine dinucleotide biosynthesis protein A